MDTDSFAAFYKEYSKEITGLIGFLGAGVGFLVRAVWEKHWSERFVSNDTLLKRLREGRLTEYGIERLQKDAAAALSEWQSRVPPPAGPAESRLRRWPDIQVAIYARPVSTPENQSACPDISKLSGIPPLFIRLLTSNRMEDRYENLGKAESLGHITANRSVEELRKRFQELASSIKESRDLISIGKWPQGNYPLLWFFAPEIAIHNTTDLTILLQRLADEARLWIPGVKIVLEAHISNDLTKHETIRDKIISEHSDDSSAQQVNNTSLPNYGARYANSRNLVQAALSKGMSLGQLERADRFSIPDEILLRRLGTKLNISECSPRNWTTLPVYGPPGSGKTETARLIVQQLTSEHRAVVLICSTPETLRDVEAFRKRNREEAFFDLSRDICITSDLLPARYKDQESVEAFMDSLYNSLTIGHPDQEVVIVVDDLHARREIREALAACRSEASDWRIHFILIGRTKIETMKEENKVTVELECEPWKRTEMEQILKSWFEPDRHMDVEVVVREGWLAKRENFSIYLLRTIAENIDDLKQGRDKPSTLLTNAINKHLSSLSLEFKSKMSPADMLIRVEELLRAAEAPERILEVIKQDSPIDYVSLLGTLSWHSQFENQDDVLDSNKVREWAKGHISTKEEAEGLLTAGAKVGIFTDLRGAAMWHDKLISDGCAALYLGRQIEKGALSEALIAEMIEQLNNSNSIEILTLALDTPVMLSIIKAIANAKPGLAHLITNLITSDFLLQLKRSPEKLHGLWTHLWKHGSKAQISQTQPYSLVLHKLISLDHTLEQKCREAIENGQSGEAVLGLTTEALRYPDSTKFFSEVEPIAPPYLLTVSTEIAARFCSPKDWGGLLKKLQEITEQGGNESEVKRIWSICCNRQRVIDLFDMIDHFLSNLAVDNEVFLELSLIEIVANRKPSEVSKFETRIKGVQHRVKQLAKERNVLGNRLVKWIALYYASDTIQKAGDWIISTEGTFAIPKTSYDALTVRQIFAKIGLAYPRLELPSSSEIRRLRRSEGALPELVRDNLPTSFSYKEGFQAVNCAIWDGGLSIVSHDKIGSMMLAWRPKFNLEL